MNPSLAVVISAAGFGFLSLFSSIASRSGTTVETHLFLRFSVASVILFFVALKKRAFRSDTNARDWLWLVVAGAGCYYLESLTFFHGLRHAPSSVMALLLYTFPVPVTLISVLFFNERLTPRKIAAVALAVIGAGFIAGPTKTGPISTTGVLLGIASSVIYAVYILLGTHRLSRINAWVASFGVCVSTALSYGIASSIQGFAWPQSTAGWLASIASGSLSTALAISFLLIGLPKIGAVSASTLSTIEPLVATLLGIFCLHEPFGLSQFIGSSAILAAMLIAARSR